MRLIDADQFGVVSFQGKSEDFIEGVCFILDKIYEAPTVEERPHGEWIFKNDNILIPTGYWECSICKKGRLMVEENFCPNCGASMQANDRQVASKLNSEIEKSKSEIVPDYRDGWRLKEGEAE